MLHCSALALIRLIAPQYTYCLSLRASQLAGQICAGTVGLSNAARHITSVAVQQQPQEQHTSGSLNHRQQQQYQQQADFGSAPLVGRSTGLLLRLGPNQQLHCQQLSRACLHSGTQSGPTHAAATSTPAAAAGAAAVEDLSEPSKAITRHLRDATSLQQMLLLVSQHSSHFNAINVAAAFTRVARLCSVHEQQHQQQQDDEGEELSSSHDSSSSQVTPPSAEASAAPPLPAVSAGGADAQLLLQQLAVLWQQQLQSQQAGPRELASVLLACSKLSFFQPELWSSTLSALLQQVNSLNIKDASSSLYALATAAAANSSCVPGVSRNDTSAAALALSSIVCTLAMSDVWRQQAAAAAAGNDSSSRSSTASSSRRRSRRDSSATGGGAAGGGDQQHNRMAGQAISLTLWSLARLGVQPPLAELSGLLQGLAMPDVLGAGKPLAVVNTLWALSELQQLPGWSRNAAAAAAVRTSTLDSKSGNSTAAAAGGGSKGGARQHRHQLLDLIPSVLVSDQQLGLVASSSSQAVSNTVLAVSRFAAGPLPHLMDVPTAQSCIRQLLQGRTAAALATWNAQDVGNAVFAASQVGAVEPDFLQAVINTSPQWLPDAGAASVVQVALGFARLKHKHCNDFLEALVLRGKQLLLLHDHHNHHTSRGHAAATPVGGSSGISSSPEGSDAEQQRQQQQQQHECERLAADLSWAIAALGQVQLAREVEQLIRASGIKQESSLHPQNARKLWAVHAWLERHKLAGGHGLTRLLTEQQLAFCAASSRHTHRVTPPAAAAAARTSG